MEFDFTKEPGKEWKHKYSPAVELALITIITPFYNAGKHFEQTFNSVMNQTFPWFEWIIVNDGSTVEEDIRILEDIEKRDGRIRVISQKNGGLSCARNTGFANAKTDIVVPLDADDIIAPQYIEYLYFGMYYNPEAAWCYTCSTGFGAEEYLWKYGWNTEKIKTYNFLNYSAAIRKKDAEEIGGYKVEKWSYFEDWRFWLEMLGQSKKPVHLGGYLFWYRRLNSGMLSTIRKDPECVEFCDNIIKEAASHVDTSVEAKEYPLWKSETPYRMPQIFQWDERRKHNPVHDKIRMVILIPWMTLGGADKFNLDLIKGLDRDKFEVSIISTVPGVNDWQQRFEDYTDEIFNLPDFLDSAYYVDYISYYIQSREIDLMLVTNSYRGYYMIPWLRKHYPKLVIADYIHMEEWYWKEGGYARPSGMLEDLLDKTYVCNSATRDVMTNIFHRSKESVQTLYIGVDQEEYSSKKVKDGYLHKLLKLEPEQPIILFPCRITAQKRPLMLVDIALKVKEKHPEAVFVVVGDGDQFYALKDKIKESHMEKTVYCIGRSDYMKECYRDAKLTLICSLKEGLSLTAYESCAMGVPVISSDAGGQKDLIDDTVGRLIPLMQEEKDDYNGERFEEEEIQAFADAVDELLSDEKQYLFCKENARKKIETGFSTKKMVETFSKEMEELLKNEELQKKHLLQASYLNELGNMAEEFYVMEHAAENWERECEGLWYERDRIMNMRTWKVISKYRSFMDNTKIGQMIRGTAKRIYHLFRK